MPNRLLSMSVDASTYPEIGVSGVIEHILQKTGLTKAVVLILERSDTHPTYTIATAASGDVEDPAIQALDGTHGEWFLSRPETGSVSILKAKDLQSVDSRLCEFFGDSAWCVPVPGVRYISIGGNPGKCPSGTAAYILLGPIASNCRLLDEASLGHLLDAVSAIMGNCLREIYMRDAFESCSRVMSTFPLLDDSATALDLGRSVLAAVHEAVPYEAAVLYFRDLEPGCDRYLLFGASVGESRDILFKSYWSQAEKGTTWRVMVDKRPAAGTIADLGRVQAKRTNTLAFEASLPPEDVHRAWAVVPFIHGNEPVAVAHLEGVNRLHGLTRSRLYTLMIAGRLLGSEIFKWLLRQRSDRRVLPDSDLVSALHGLLPPVNLPSNNYRRPEGRASLFEKIVGHAFRHCAEVEDVTARIRREIRARSMREQKMDCVIISLPTSKTVVIEVTLEADSAQSSALGKLRQLADYLDYVPNSVGILVVGGEWKVSRCGPHGSKTIMVMDRTRLERFCALPPTTRTVLLRKWANALTAEITMCDCQV